MTKRRQSRELAFKLLYAMDLSGDDKSIVKGRFKSTFNDVDKEVWEYAIKLFDKASDNINSLDSIISKLANNWSIDRISKIDKNILRLGISEINIKEVDFGIIINEFIEISKTFGDKDSHRFINGILDSYAKSI
jgi:N utilization substance protein B